jgi:hypothetical protein
MNKSSIRTLRSHTNAVAKVFFTLLPGWIELIICQVSWSRSQADALASGGADRTVRHWSLCVSPHNVVNTFDDMSRSVVGVSFSNVEPLTTFALSAAGELVALRMSSAFANRFTQHRFDDADTPEREIEDLLYARGLSSRSRIHRTEELQILEPPSSELWSWPLRTGKRATMSERHAC